MLVLTFAEPADYDATNVTRAPGRVHRYTVRGSPASSNTPRHRMPARR
jgi:hypothetical protein